MIHILLFFCILMADPFGWIKFTTSKSCKHLGYGAPVGTRRWVWGCKEGYKPDSCPYANDKTVSCPLKVELADMQRLKHGH
jgi:hypothetical protein